MERNLYMTIRHLKIFIAVAESASMSAAANRLYLTQPTVSQAIRDLENHYQVHRYFRHIFEFRVSYLHQNLFVFA